MSTTQSEIIYGYGSNISGDLLRARLNNGEWHDTEWRKTGDPVGPDPLFLGIGVLADHQFKYNLKDGDFTSGNIVANYNDHVYGAIYKITPEQLALLDRDEDEGTCYTRTALKVQKIAFDAFGASANNETVTAWCYVGKEEAQVPDDEINPDPEYVDHLIRYAEERSLPPDYIDQRLRYTAPLLV